MSIVGVDLREDETFEVQPCRLSLARVGPSSFKVKSRTMILKSHLHEDPNVVIIDLCRCYDEVKRSFHSEELERTVNGIIHQWTCTVRRRYVIVDWLEYCGRQWKAACRPLDGHLYDHWCKYRVSQISSRR